MELEELAKINMYDLFTKHRTDSLVYASRNLHQKLSTSMSSVRKNPKLGEIVIINKDSVLAISKLNVPAEILFCYENGILVSRGELELSTIQSIAHTGIQTMTVEFSETKIEIGNKISSVLDLYDRISVQMYNDNTYND